MSCKISNLGIALNRLVPVGTAVSKKVFKEILKTVSVSNFWDDTPLMVTSKEDLPIFFHGYCLACGQMSRFIVDDLFGGRIEKGRLLPNWRERLECNMCKMNNRQRLMAGLVRQYFINAPRSKSYFMEQVTPIYQWASQEFACFDLMGSEYLGFEYESGQIIDGIRHEDVENLSFKESSLDLIISNDVFEHVPNPAVAFSNCAQALKPDGLLLATFPFHHDKLVSMQRAELNDGIIENLLEPEYHGNPLSSKGSLVFTDFGWDVIEMLLQSGFRQVELEIYASRELGHFGHMPYVFRAKK
jgi:SAM-dependent methyltransferase